MRAINNEIIIFSVFQSGLVLADNEKNHDVAYRLLRSSGIPFKELQGYDNGMQEKSFLIPTRFEGIAKELCAQYNQECYLVSASDRSTELVYSNGRREPVGVFREVSRESIEGLECYSYDLETKRYWAAIR